MTDIRLYNSRTRSKEVFTPHDAQNVRMYLCGPTVYDRAHLGNARNVILFDVLQRLLRHVYGADHVTYVRNITDVDDKINAEALRRQKAGATGSLEDLIAERTAETVAWYHADMAALGADAPDHEPRATQYIPQMIAMIETLMARGHAYEKDGHVLFRVRSYAEYGALSGRSVDDMIAGARVEVAPFKEDPMDFVLWKPSSGEEPGWASPWGKGRPGWHIECSAMSAALLGNSFDIHGGGLDLQFPHHENEVAQSACAHPEGSFARYWLHNEMLLVEGKKMSKSLGNFFTVRDLLDQGVPGEVIRFVFLQTHYRKPMDWTKERASEARETLTKWRTLTANSKVNNAIYEPLVRALSNDLSTPIALDELHELYRRGDASSLLASANILGLLHESGGDWFEFGKEQTVSDHRLIKLFDQRNLARKNKDWELADNIKHDLQMVGVAIQDNKHESAMLRGHSFMARFRTDFSQKLFEAGDLENLHTLVASSRELGINIELDEEGPGYWTVVETRDWEERLNSYIDDAVVKWCSQ